MGNSPTMGVDPDGRLAWFVPIIIGAALGGTSQGIASANNGGTFAGGFWRGALVGGAAGFAAIGATAAIAGTALTATASASMGAMITGASVGGAINGGGFAALNGTDVGKGIWTGALSGFVGAGVGGAVYNTGHTGLGAFLGGASSGAVGASLNGSNIVEGALIGGALSYTMYAALTPSKFKGLTQGERRGLIKTSKAFVDDVEIRNIYNSKGENLIPENYRGGPTSVPADELILMPRGEKSYFLHDETGIQMINDLYKKGTISLDVHTHVKPRSGYLVKGHMGPDISLANANNAGYKINIKMSAIAKYNTGFYHNRTFSLWSNSIYNYSSFQNFYLNY
jgi:hypothetical protein